MSDFSKEMSREELRQLVINQLCGFNTVQSKRPKKWIVKNLVEIGWDEKEAIKFVDDIEISVEKKMGPKLIRLIKGILYFSRRALAL